MPPYPPEQLLLLSLAYPLLAAALAWTVWRRGGGLWEGLGPLDRLGPVAAAGLAFVLRATLPPRAVFHENGHGYRYIGMAVDPASDLHVYGSAYQAFHGLLYAVFPPVTEVVLWAQIALGALTVVPLGWLVARFFGGGSGLFAALALALMPLHIRLSATESLFVLSIFLTVLALWAIAELRRAPDVDLVLVTALAAAPAGQIRPVFMAAPGFILLFGLLCRRGGFAFLRSRHLWLTAGLIGALTARHVLWMAEIHLDSHYGGLLRLSPRAVREGLSDGALLLNPAFTPLHVLALGALGLLAGLWRSWRGALLLGAAFAGLTWAYAARSTYFTEALRFGVPAQVFLAALCGPGGALLARLFGLALDRRSLGFVAAAAMFFSSLLYGAGWSMETPQEREHLFLREAYAELPADCALVTSDFHLAGGNVNAPFPWYEFRHRVPGPDADSGGFLRASELEWEAATEHECLLYYRGLACVSFEREEELANLRPECEAFESAWELEPLALESLPAERFPSYRFLLAPEGEVGFFRVLEPAREELDIKGQEEERDEEPS